MDVFFLGAGESYSGTAPSALKSISKNTKALDWQLQSLARSEVEKINFIGGYQVEEIIAKYPQLNYTIAPDWRKSNVIDTLLQGPFRSDQEALILYSDTLFRPKTIELVATTTADLVVGVDSLWRTRFAHRSEGDMSSSEVLNLNSFESGSDSNSNLVEFTGLLKLAPKVINKLGEISAKKTTNLIELIDYFYQAGHSVEFIDVKGDWSEFNSDLDVAHFILGTKSETLYRLFPLVKKSSIGEQVTFTVAQWQSSRNHWITKIQHRFNNQPLVVRSSSYAEDCWDESHAGGFESVLGIASSDATAVIKAVEAVIASYHQSDSLHKDQVLVQACLSEVKMSGVVFTRTLESGGPYYRINFDDQSQSTESVTSGNGQNLRTVVVSKDHVDQVKGLSPDLIALLQGVVEIENLLGYDKLDIEFAIDQQDQLHIFQVRPIAVSHENNEVEDSEVAQVLAACVDAFKSEQAPGPGLVGDATYFGVMPDWNPAEIIGIKPKPLAYSLYRHLIVDQIWAIQRSEFGYRDVSQYPLIRTFAGQPYVNIRNSLNSFIPKSMSEPAASRICDAYLSHLHSNPHLHDKLEFAVAFTVLTPDFDDLAAIRFKDTVVTPEDLQQLKAGLLEITDNAFTRLPQDVFSLAALEANRAEILQAEIPPLNQALLLLDAGKKFGTLAFAHAARAGFVAMSFLNSLVQLKVICQTEKERFLSSFKTVAGEFESAASAVANGTLSKQHYLNSYGHLRPGTYDITAKAYWENPEQYLFTQTPDHIKPIKTEAEFSVSNETNFMIEKVLSEMGIAISAADFWKYCQQATQAREKVKFEFSKNLSKALDLLVVFGKQYGIKRKQLAFCTLADLREFSLGVLHTKDLKKVIKIKKKLSALSNLVELPQIIMRESDFYGFERNASEPNFVTSKSVEAASICSTDDPSLIKGMIVFIEQADPGYDWMFAYDLAGLVTKYGGANSHMAIRAAELNLPAAIGVGDKIYDELKSAKIIRLNCGLKQIIKVK